MQSELVKWSSTFSVGVKLVDDQHKELLKLTNDLFNHCVGDEEAERTYFKKVINKAVDYVKVHFATEEKIMIATKFPGYWEHKREHDAFVLTVVEQVRAFNDGKPFTLLTFTKFLKDWILTHIAVTDKKYFDYFKKIATRKANGKLSITQADVKR
ncbi:MAG: bacteriohemerythrin [Treponema sp.]|jgi:hemerythrin|nr:bacteriohemerythrin [Treponema sp.]MDR1278396.1 bacteriohemerythrin [Treponema sp.]